MHNREIWKPVNGYDGMYEVSNHGRVRSYATYRGVKHRETPRIMTGAKTLSGYHFVKFTYNGKKPCPKRHRLVAEAFIPNPENKPEINHVDGNKDNNHVSNLEWCTGQENKDHAIKNGLTARGVRNCKSKITPKEVKEIRKMYSTGDYYQKDIANVFGLKQSQVSKIILKHSWSHI